MPYTISVTLCLYRYWLLQLPNVEGVEQEPHGLAHYAEHKPEYDVAEERVVESLVDA